MTSVALVGLVAYALAAIGAFAVRRRAARALTAADGANGVPAGGSAPPPTGAELAERFLAERGLGVVRVVRADVDAYRAVTRELQLGAGRDARASAAAWAVAAHETSHAALHRAGDRAWQRWWVLSGHTVWASLLVPLLLAVQLVVDKPVPLLLAAPLVVLLAACAGLSWKVERRAAAAAREMLAGAGLPPEPTAVAAALVPKLAAAYVAESLVDTSAVSGWLRR